MNVLCKLLLVAGLLAGCSQPPATPTASPTASAPVDAAQKGKIQAGVGVETVRLGMNQLEVEKILGKPEAVDQFTKSQVFLSYYKRGLEIGLGDGKVEAITCHAQEEQWQAYPGATPEGLWVGSSRADFEKTLKGGKTFSEALKYPDLGLRIVFTAKGATSTISVLKPEK